METPLNSGVAAAVAELPSKQKLAPSGGQRKTARSPYAYARDFLDNQYVYLAISPRARGLSVGVNMNPDAQCNFDCVYCEVDRSEPRETQPLDLDLLALELEKTLTLVHSPQFQTREPYSALPQQLLRLRHVALSGDGEPTLCPQFLEAVETVAHVRARGTFPFFKIVLITNGSHLDRPEVQAGLSLFTSQDEVWIKLEAGTQEYMNLINRPSESLDKILANILLTAKIRPVVIQSLFSEVNGKAPDTTEIERYALRLRDLKEAGAKIALVQIYSATRPTPHVEVRHLSLRAMAGITETVRRITGLPTQLF